MRAAILRAQGPIDTSPLRIEEVGEPTPGDGEILVRVEACGCCRTDVHVIEGDLPPKKLPVIPGHQIVGRVVATGRDVSDFRPGDRAGIAWLRHVDGTCKHCMAGRENLCPNSAFTGYTADGGYAEYALAPAAFAYRLPPNLPAVEAAPLLCAGIIGYRALKRSLVQPGQRLGIYGFGSSAHVTIQIALHWGCEVFVATRGTKHRTLAREMGASWVGEAAEIPPQKLDGAILFAPAGELVPAALQALERGGALAIAGIYLSRIPALDYESELFNERSVCSVTANTRADGRELLTLAGQIPIRARTEIFELDRANLALQKLKAGELSGSAVIAMK